MEENFQAGNALTGLGQHQVRRWASWYRWVTLAKVAAAFLTITAAAEHARHPQCLRVRPAPGQGATRAAGVSTRPMRSASIVIS